MHYLHTFILVTPGAQVTVSFTEPYAIVGGLCNGQLVLPYCPLGQYLVPGPAAIAYLPALCRPQDVQFTFPDPVTALLVLTQSTIPPSLNITVEPPFQPLIVGITVVQATYQTDGTYLYLLDFEITKRHGGTDIIHYHAVKPAPGHYIQIPADAWIKNNIGSPGDPYTGNYAFLDLNGQPDGFVVADSSSE